jgi:plasmid stability protein
MESKLLQINVPVELRERLRAVAKRDRRSMSAEALTMLEAEVNRREQLDADVADGKTQVNPDFINRIREQAGKE